MSPGRALGVMLGVMLAAMPGCKDRGSTPAARADEPPAAREGAGDSPGAGTSRSDDARAVDIPHRRFATETEAIQHVLARRPRILGVGVFHQTHGAAPVRPTLERFIDVLDLVAASASDLIVETWVEDGACGSREQAVSTQVRETTERPPEVENQVMTLLTRARDRGVAPHVLTLGCNDYGGVLDDKGEVDYERMLVLVKRKLADTASQVWALRQGGERAIVIYGGALHNDLHPHEGLAEMSYAAEAAALAGDRYIELDLYVPEFIAGNALIVHEPWYPVFEREAGPDRVILIERSAQSYVLILRTGVLARP